MTTPTISIGFKNLCIVLYTIVFSVMVRIVRITSGGFRGEVGVFYGFGDF